MIGVILSVSVDKDDCSTENQSNLITCGTWQETVANVLPKGWLNKQCVFLGLFYLLYRNMRVRSND